jgi:hypothetical protein
MSLMEPEMSAVLSDGLALFQSGSLFCVTRGYAKPPPRAESFNAFGVPGVSDPRRSAPRLLLTNHCSPLAAALVGSLRG